MLYTYKTKGVCSKKIVVDLEGDIIKSVAFHGGCEGNLKGISALIAGMKVTEVIEKFDNIQCGRKNTSCPDQLSKALMEVIGQKND